MIAPRFEARTKHERNASPNQTLEPTRRLAAQLIVTDICVVSVKTGPLKNTDTVNIYKLLKPHKKL